MRLILDNDKFCKRAEKRDLNSCQVLMYRLLVVVIFTFMYYVRRFYRIIFYLVLSEVYHQSSAYAFDYLVLHQSRTDGLLLNWS